MNTFRVSSVSISRLVCIGVACIALGLGLPARAQVHTTLVGGGAGLPAPGLVGTGAHRQMPPLSGSLLYAYSNLVGAGNPQVSYCRTDSSQGKAVFTGVFGDNVQGSCPDSGTLIMGFGAPAVLRTDLLWPNFSVSDSPLSASDYNNYIASRIAQPLAFPAMAGSIAIGYSRALRSQLNLTNTQLCSIYNGTTTTWDQLVAGQPADPIHVVFRSDGSGSTFSLMNHLAKVCGFTAPASHFLTSEKFSMAVSEFFPVLPSTWHGVGGDKEVANYVAADASALGYVGFADAAMANLHVATVNGISPASIGATPMPVSVSYNQLVIGLLPDGEPALGPIPVPPGTQCIALVPPSTYAAPASGYPIIAITYLLANSTANGTDAANVRKLLGAPYNVAVRNSVVTSATPRMGVANSGLAFLANPDMTQSKFDGCVIN